MPSQEVQRTFTEGSCEDRLVGIWSHVVDLLEPWWYAS